MALRKRSSEVAGSVKDGKANHLHQVVVKSPTKNLLTEFEKDETLEPNSTVFTDTTTITSIAAASPAVVPN